MLQQYFGFRDDPFGVTPDPRFLYRSHSHTHREALASLQYGFYNNRGFTALIAPPGLGKTTLLFRFLSEIRESPRTVFLFDTRCEPRELIGYILHDLGIAPGRDSVEMHAQLNSVLVAEAHAGRKFVVVIDEAQNLSDAALETVRLLTNFETPRVKLMQIVLAGQPQLSDNLMNPSLVQLRQRISTVCRLERFSEDDTLAYIGHRLKLGGYHGAPLFTNDSLTLIAAASQGIPRTINNLCFNALSLCCAMKRKQVDGFIVAEAISDQQWLPQTGEVSAPTDDVAAGQRREPERRKQRTRLIKLWAVSAAVLLFVSVLGTLGLSEVDIFRSHKTGFSRRGTESPAAAVTTPAKTISNDTPVVRTTLKATPLEVTVEPNQTLGNIAMHYLGNFDRQRLEQIRTLNPELIDPDDIQPGQKIRLPDPVGKTSTQPVNVRNLP